MLFNSFADLRQDPSSSAFKPSTPNDVNQEVGQHTIQEELFKSKVVKIEKDWATFPFAISNNSLRSVEKTSLKKKRKRCKNLRGREIYNECLVSHTRAKISRVSNRGEENFVFNVPHSSESKPPSKSDAAVICIKEEVSDDSIQEPDEDFLSHLY